MPKVSIIGVGDVGATIAYTLQLSGLATEIVLVDLDQERAKGQAMDMGHGLFFTPPARIAAGGYEDCAGSDLIVVTAGARQRPGESRTELTARNAEICRNIIRALRPWVAEAKVLVITNPVDVMTYVVLKELGGPSGRVFGSGTVLDSARFRYELSRRCGVDPRSVHAYVIGEHGDSEVFLWSHVNIGGVPLETFCRGCPKGCMPEARGEIEEAVRRSAYHIIEAKGYTNYGVSLAVTRIAGAVLRDEKSVLTVSTLLQGEYGLEGLSVSVPCVVGAKGVERVLETFLPPDETEALLSSAEKVKGFLDDLYPA